MVPDPTTPPILLLFAGSDPEIFLKSEREESRNIENKMKTHKVITTIFLLLILTTVYLFAGTSQWRFSVRPTKTSTINVTRKEGVNEGAMSTNLFVGSTLLSSFQRILIESAESTEVDSCKCLFHAEVFLSDARLQSELQAVLFYNSHD
jgi:hypothetical protein